jgi:cytochrome c553
VSDREIKMDAGNRFLMVVSLVALAAVLGFMLMHLVQFVGQLGLAERDPEPEELVAQRIAPVGRVVAVAIDRDAPPAPARAASDVYRSVCAACHDAGVAGAPRADDAAEWRRRLDEKGLDTLVRHSIQGFQGMPARGGNPNLSDEEVTGVVEYILAGAGIDLGLPGEVIAASPDEPAVDTVAVVAVAGDATAGQGKFAACVSCHGAEAMGMGIFPRLSGHPATYISERLQSYRAGVMVGPMSPLMMPHAANLSDEDIADLAAYVAVLGGLAEEPAAAATETVPVLAEAAGDAAAGQQAFAACVSCHGPQGQGMAIFPKIAGQTAEYISGRLKQYRAGEMVGPTSPLMMPHAAGLSDAQIADLAAYVSGL